MKIFLLSAILFCSNLLMAEAVWSQKPIQVPDATVDSYYSFDLRSFIKNDDDSVYTVGSFHAPHWMHVSMGGMISGTPSKRDHGEPLFTLRLTDSYGEIDDVEVFLRVK